ncbi:MAG: antibiotic biosynthesis monooxygenase [Candidatus Lokiarchaeota archaeon]|nr:antibiotic biosynthesis monooxygenase [Candidatus Lokiarchaeota archaeon]
MFSICTAFVENGKLEETLKQYADSERKFTKEIGVLFRKFFQCQIQPHIIWSITEWESEKAHHDAAQSIMEIRRDDRFAAIAFGPEPYFEIFCNEEESLNSGKFSEKLQIVIVIHGLISEKVKDKYLEIRKERIREHREQFHWLRVFYNTYNSNEFVSFLGFNSEDYFNKIRKIDDYFLEEYLFTGLRNPLGMSYIANYNQFICKPIKF